MKIKNVFGKKKKFSLKKWCRTLQLNSTGENPPSRLRALSRMHRAFYEPNKNIYLSFINVLRGKMIEAGVQLISLTDALIRSRCTWWQAIFP